MRLTKNKKAVIIITALVAVLFLLTLRFSAVLEWMDGAQTSDLATSTLQIIPSEGLAITAISDLTQKFSSETFASSTYIKVTDGCGPHFEGECLNVRLTPSTGAEVTDRLRNGQVLKVARLLEAEGVWWYQVVFDEWLRYPDRIEGDWFVAAEFVERVEPAALVEPQQSEEVEKRIVVDLSEQKLYAYEGEEVFMETDISTGLFGTLTPRGTFTVFYRTPSRYMQGPLPGISDDEYDLPGVPWNLYFTQQGAVIHGAYWHDNFGMNWSHGCVNLPPEQAKKLYEWTPEGAEVRVQD